MEKREKYSSELNRLRPMDDVFMRAILAWSSEKERLKIGQWLLQAIMDEDPFCLKSVESQKDLVQAGSRHSVVLDMLAQDVRGNLYNVEFQKSAAEVRRVTFYSSILGSYALEKGKEYDELPDTHTIFITDKHHLKNFPSEIEEDGPVVEWGSVPHMKGPKRVFLVDAAYKGADPLGEMLEDLWCADPTQIKHPVLRKVACELKHTEKGREHMCDIIDELVMEGEQRAAQKEREKAQEKIQNERKKARKARKEDRIATVKRLLADGVTDLAWISKIAGYPLEEVKKLAEA